MSPCCPVLGACMNGWLYGTLQGKGSDAHICQHTVDRRLRLSLCGGMFTSQKNRVSEPRRTPSSGTRGPGLIACLARGSCAAHKCCTMFSVMSESLWKNYHITEDMVRRFWAARDPFVGHVVGSGHRVPDGGVLCGSEMLHYVLCDVIILPWRFGHG